MGRTKQQTPWKELRRLIDQGESDRLDEFVRQIPDIEIPHTLSLLGDEALTELLHVVEPETAAVLMEQMPGVRAVETMEHLDREDAAAILLELPSSEQADFLHAMEQGDADAILAEMIPEAADSARTLCRYDNDVAGGLMDIDYLAYPHNFTATEVIRDMRTNADTYRDYVVQYAFVLDEQERLLGVLRLRDLLLAEGDRPIVELMQGDPLAVGDFAPLDELRSFFLAHLFFGVPVTDAAGRLLGIVRRAAVEEALADRSDSAYLKTQGIVGGEELRSMPFLLRARRRLAWLSVNVVLNVVAATVIAFYQETLTAVIALAVFLPIISDMSGCSGNQAVAVSMRELSLGLVRPSELLRVWAKELSVGLMNGLVLGALIAGVAWLWKGNPYLGLVVGAAMALNTLVAVSIGGTVPLLMRRLKMDPALASGPILTTVTDMCGFFLVLSLATRFLPWISG